MKKSGAWLVRYALEQIGVRHTFGIPGVHNTEIYDELNNSEIIQPILVTHECGGAFMADAVSRTSDSIGCLIVVPAAGITHAASGIAEAFLDGIPMLVISGGVRTDGMAYQLHDMDQHGLMAPITKATYKIERQDQIIDTIYRAYELAIGGEPGPVFIEVPVNISLFRDEVGEILPYHAKNTMEEFSPIGGRELLRKAAIKLSEAANPGIFVGWGAVDATAETKAIAEWLAAPVSTTLQGLSAFPTKHPLHTGMGFGPAAVSAARNAFKQCDCLLAVGTRFSEIPTGSFGCEVPKNLIHIDINPAVFDANYPTAVAIQGDAKIVLAELYNELCQIMPSPRDSNILQQKIASDKADYKNEWLVHNVRDKVNPARLFHQLDKKVGDDVIIVADDGNHTFLTAELMPITKPRYYISPTDFNCMGYCVPAVIGAQLANPQALVCGIVGDGAFLMTCMELITAVSMNMAPILFVFSDGELSQISQTQALPYNRKTCTVLGPLRAEGIAMATGAEFLYMADNRQIDAVLDNALQLATGDKPVIVDVNVDYSKQTQFTKGIVGTNLKRFSLSDKARFIGRAVKRKVIG